MILSMISGGAFAKTKFSKAFDDLTTTGIKMNGRMNDNTIILQAF